MANAKQTRAVRGKPPCESAARREMFLGYDPLEKADSLARASSLRFDGIHLRYERKSCALSINAHFRHYRERDVEHHPRKRRTSLHTLSGDTAGIKPGDRMKLKGKKAKPKGEQSRVWVATSGTQGLRGLPAMSNMRWEL